MDYTISSEAAMKMFGQVFGRLLKGSECLMLIGDVGAGKTTFTKGLAAGMAITETVQSPTFTVNRVYDAPDGRRLSHYDFYRLDDPGIMKEELQETLESGAIVCIEWGDPVKDILPSGAIHLRISARDDTTRTIRIDAPAKIIEKIKEGLHAVHSA